MQYFVLPARRQLQLAAHTVQIPLTLRLPHCVPGLQLHTHAQASEHKHTNASTQSAGKAKTQMGRAQQMLRVIGEATGAGTKMFMSKDLANEQGPSRNCNMTLQHTS